MFIVRIEPPCKQAKKEYLEQEPMLGRYEPDCDEDGYYKPRQCHENYCWCVDRYNQVIEGTKKEARLVNCRKFINMKSFTCNYLEYQDEDLVIFRSLTFLIFYITFIHQKCTCSEGFFFGGGGVSPTTVKLTYSENLLYSHFL